FTPKASAVATITTFTDLLRETRWKVFAALEQAAAGRTAFVKHVASDLLIARSTHVGWVPVDRAGASLRGRVLSLFAVDCLLRPDDYRTLLLACPQCEGIVFDVEARTAGRCCVNGRAASGERP